jgi:hypothetical protein
MNDPAAEKWGIKNSEDRIQKSRIIDRSSGFKLNLVLLYSGSWLLNASTIMIFSNAWYMILRGKPRGIGPQERLGLIYQQAVFLALSRTTLERRENASGAE